LIKVAMRCGLCKTCKTDVGFLINAVQCQATFNTYLIITHDIKG